MLFDLVYSKGWGTLRIQNFMSSDKIINTIPSPSGKKGWSRASIQHVLTNPLYKGYYVYGRRDNNGKNQTKDKWIMSEKQILELVIVEEEIWEKVQQIRTAKSPANRSKKDEYKQIGSSSPLLLIGLIKCGHCGNIVSTTYNYARWTTQDGEKKVNIKPIYRCNGRIDKRVKCDGQTTYRKTKIEGVVLFETMKFIDELQGIDFTREISKMKIELKNQYGDKINELKNRKEDIYSDLKILDEEFFNIKKGKSNWSEEKLLQMQKDKEDELKSSQEEIDKIQTIVQQKNLEIDDIEFLRKHIINWKIMFNEADDDEKKILLARVIDSVRVFRNKVEINFKIYFKNFVEEAKKLQYLCITKESEPYTFTVVKLFEKQVVIEC
jgi:hypothetical protein